MNNLEHAKVRGFHDPDAASRRRRDRMWERERERLARRVHVPRVMQRMRKAAKLAAWERVARQRIAQEKMEAMEVRLGLRVKELWPEPGEMTPEALQARQDRLLERSYALQDRAGRRV